MNVDKNTVVCDKHGVAYETFVCSHLIETPAQDWYSREITESNPWPDAWCENCDKIYLRDGGWNDENSEEVEINLICNCCYEECRSKEA